MAAPHTSTQTNQNAALAVQTYRSLAQIDPDLWGSICGADGLASRHGFIHSLQKSQVEDAEYWYLLVFRGEELVSAAVLSCFIISLDLLNPFLLGIAGMMRKVIPNFLRIRVLFCGLPISLGKSCLCSKYETLDAAMIDCIVCEMERIAQDNQIGMLCAKEFSEDMLRRTQRFVDHGYVRANSIPRVGLRIRWQDYATYLNSMRAGYRRQIMASLRRAGLSLSGPLTGKAPSGLSRGVNLELVRPTPELATVFAALYAQVMDHVTVKLETLNEAFFRHLFEALADDLELLLMRDRDRILGAALLSQCDSRLQFLLVGLDYERLEEYETYFNLMNGIVALAIERGCSFVELGQTSYHAKQRIGGETEGVYFYLKARRPWTNAALRAFQRFLFPHTRLQQMHVFRNSEAG